MRFGLTERGVVEILALAEHVTGVAVAAAGFQLRREDVSNGVPPTAEAGSSPPALAEIGDWASARLGVDGVPRYWQLVAQKPRFLKANWDTHRLVLDAGELDQKAKALIALGVAAYNKSDFWVQYFTLYSQATVGMTGAELVDTLAAAMHSASYNTIAHGMMVHPDPEHVNMRSREVQGGRSVDFHPRTIEDGA